MSSAPGERRHRVAGVADDEDRRAALGVPLGQRRALGLPRPSRCRGPTADPAPNSGYFGVPLGGEVADLVLARSVSVGVGAVDRDVGVEQVGVGAVLEPAGVAVGEGEHALRSRPAARRPGAWASCGQDAVSYSAARTAVRTTPGVACARLARRLAARDRASAPAWASRPLDELPRGRRRAGSRRSGPTQFAAKASKPASKAGGALPRRRPAGRRRGRRRRRAPGRAPCRGTARRRWSRAWCRRSSRGR